MRLLGRSFDLDRINDPVGILIHLFAVEKWFAVAVNIGNDRIEKNGILSENTGCTPFFRNEGKTVFPGFIRCDIVDGLSLHDEFSAAASVIPEERVEKLCTPGSDKAGYSEHFALMQLEADIMTGGLVAA